MSDNYTVYHLHTENSLLDSCTNYKLYIDKAKELGQTAIAFTEHGNIYNWIEKKMYCDKNGIKFIHGIEIYLTETLQEKIRDNYHTILLAKNYDGVKEINELIELSTRKDHTYYKPRISFDEFFLLSDNVIKISACLASPLNKMRECINKRDLYEKLCKKYDYFEIQPHINSEEQIEYNKFLYWLSQQYNTPLIMGTDTHSLNEYKAECRSVLQLSKHIEFSNEDECDLTYKSYDELIAMCKKQNSLPIEVYLEAINNTNVMADSVEDWKIDTSIKYPKSYDNEEEIQWQRINKMYEYKVSNGIIDNNPQYLENIKEEMRVFKKTNMIGFMLFMSELMCWCKENGIPTSPCRGSVGGSTVAYITDIIDVNPVKWNTVFSRFANEDRLEVGDIDVDIAPDQRNMVYQHIIDKFTEEKTAYILAIGTISDKGTIDDIGRALSYRWIKENFGELSNKLIQKYGNHSDNPYALDKIAIIKEEYEKSPEKTKTKYPKLFYYFDGLLNTAVSQSMHPAGIVVSPITLSDNYGVFWGTNKDGDDVLILSINMEEVHESGLVKYDILGLKQIQVLRECCEFANMKYPLSHEINWEDEDAWEHIVDSPVGIFQFEGEYAFSLLKQYKPKKINDLSIVNASLRPSGASYRDRLLAGEINHNPSEQIDELLKDNNGFLIFQEDTIKFLQQICGLSGSEADNVRRAIGRKQTDRLQKALPQILEGYCNKSDKPRDVAEQEAKAFLQIIEDSSNYQFGYNHSTGYSMVAYLCAYMRRKYPTEFITAYLNSSKNMDDITGGTNLAKTLGIKIEGIKFRKSKDKYMPDSDKKMIYKGISSIKYMNAIVANEMYELRNNHYNNFVELLYDLKEKTTLNSKQLEILISLDFFSEFGESNYLSKLSELFNDFYGKVQAKKDKLDSLNIDYSLVRQFSVNETEKMFTKLDSKRFLIELSKSISVNPRTLKDKISSQIKHLGYCDIIDERYKGMVAVLELDTKYSPKLHIHSLKNGTSSDVKIDKKTFNKNKIAEGDILRIINCTKKQKMRKSQNGFEPVPNEFEIWITKYLIVNEI